MQFLCVEKPVRATIFGEPFQLMPLDSRTENLRDILTADDFSAKELFSRHSNVLRTVTFDASRMKGFPQIIGNVRSVREMGRVLILRNGGIGDHVMYLPVLEILRDALPTGMEIWLATQKEKEAIYAEDPSIDKILPLPVRLDTVLKADYLIDMSAGEDASSIGHMNMTDYFLDQIGLSIQEAEKKIPRMSWTRRLSPYVAERIEGIRKDEGSPVVLLNWRASSRLRDIPAEKLLFLSDEFEKDISFVVAQPRGLREAAEKEILGYNEKIFDLSPHMHSLDDYITTISRCDAVVSTDTSTGHLAEALGISSLILFGPIDDDLRIRYYPNAYALRAEYSGRSCCSPCGLSKIEGCCFEAVLEGTRFSPCLLSISKDKIRSAFVEFMERIS